MPSNDITSYHKMCDLHLSLCLRSVVCTAPTSNRIVHPSELNTFSQGEALKAIQTRASNQQHQATHPPSASTSKSYGPEFTKHKHTTQTNITTAWCIHTHMCKTRAFNQPHLLCLPPKAARGNRSQWWCSTLQTCKCANVLLDLNRVFAQVCSMWMLMCIMV